MAVKLDMFWSLDLLSARVNFLGRVPALIGHVIFFRKRLRVVDRELAIQSLISFRCLYLGQIGCQGDGVSRQPGWGTQVIYDACVGGSEI